MKRDKNQKLAGLFKRLKDVTSSRESLAAR